MPANRPRRKEFVAISCTLRVSPSLVLSGVPRSDERNNEVTKKINGGRANALVRSMALEIAQADTSMTGLIHGLLIESGTHPP